MLQKVLNKLDLSCSYFIKGRLNTKEFFNELPFKVEANILNSIFMKNQSNLKLSMKKNIS